MKIAFFTDDYLPYMHGVVTSMQTYRAALEKMGHEVYIIAPNPTDKDFDDNDDHVIRTRSANSRMFENRPVSMVYPGMARAFDKYDFDIIHSHTQFYVGFLGHMVAKRKQIPHVSTLHTLFTELSDDYRSAVLAGLFAISVGYPMVFQAKPVIPFASISRDQFMTSWRDIMKTQGWKVINIFLNHTSHVIVPSGHLRDTLIEHGLHAPSTLLPNGISLDDFSPTKKRSNAVVLPLKKKRGERWIIATGRLSGEKRQEVVVRAMAELTDLDVKLIIIGDGPDKKKLEQIARDLNITDKVYFTGMQPRNVVAAWTRTADIACLASYRFDNQPMVILESLAAGLPFVYCDDKLKEGLTRNNSILTKSIEAEGFADAFRKLIENPAKLQKMSAVSLTQSKKYDIDVLAKKLVKIYEISRPMKRMTISEWLRLKLGAGSHQG